MNKAKAAGLNQGRESQIEIRKSLRIEVRKQNLEALLLFYLGCLGLPKASVDVLICGNRESQTINRNFRKKNKPTDILSFPSLVGKAPKGSSAYLGDLALNYPFVRSHFPRFCHDLQEELALLLLHGLLHLAGYHHDSPRAEKAMWKIQNQLLEKARSEFQSFRLIGS